MEMVELIPVTKAHGLEEKEIGKMDKQLKRVAKKGMSLMYFSLTLAQSAGLSFSFSRSSVLDFRDIWHLREISVSAMLSSIKAILHPLSARFQTS